MIDPTPHRRLMRWSSRYGVHLGVVVVLAIVLAVAPTTNPDRTNTFANRGLSGQDTAPGGTALDESTSSTGLGTAPAGGPGPSVDEGSSGTAATGPAAAGGPQLVGEDCSRRELLGGGFPCRPVVEGATAPAGTYQGVDEDSITVVYYLAPVNEQVNSVVAGQGYSTDPAHTRSMLEAFAEWGNESFELWGRSVDLIVHESNVSDPNDEPAFRAEAVRMDEELNAFMVVGAGSTAFIDELARRGVICICGVQYPESFHAQYAPFAWSLGPSGDTTNAHIAEYIAKRLGVTSNADYGGAGTKGKPRQYGIIYPNDIYADNATDLERRLAEYGIPVRVKARYELSIETGIQQATNIAQQMKQAGVTTILCVCDPVAPYFLYTALNVQNYKPEHFQTGYFWQDTYGSGQFYDQDQYSRNFGISVAFPVPQPRVEDEPGYRVYTSKRPGQPIPIGVVDTFRSFATFLLGLENAGAALDPSSFEAGMRSIDIRSTNQHEVSISFPSGTYGPAFDAQEVWWNPGKPAPNGKAGDFESVNAGRRYRLGEWPTVPSGAFRAECLPRGSCGLPS